MDESVATENRFDDIVSTIVDQGNKASPSRYFPTSAMEQGIFVVVCTSLTIMFGGTLTAAACNTSGNSMQSRIGLLVSPLMSPIMIHQLEIYWNNMDHRAGDLIGIFTEKPRQGLDPVYTVTPTGPSGYEKTEIRAEFIPSSNLSFTKQCLKHHVAWLRDGSIKDANCLKTQPNWMQEMKSILGPLTISKLFLPGTHNSGSYALYARPTAENFIEKYAITQDADVLAQLVHGVRYLDIRMGHYPQSEEVWWINHGIYRSVPLQSVVDQIKTFLDNTEEIVIFDVQEFPIGFGKNLTVHLELVSYLQKEFADYLLPKNHGWTSTLASIWALGRRLIIGYDDARVVARYENIWPCVTHQWGNVRNIDALFEYLNRIETTYRGIHRITPRSAMAELTPNTLDVLLNRLGGLRQMAHSVNINVTNWYSSIWQYTANIVAVDFVRSTGIVEAAIESNLRRNCVPGFY